MKYKVLFLDYDGTIAPVGPQTKVNLPSTKVANTIKNANQHLSVCLATGRTLHQVKRALKLLQLEGFAILLNGAQIINSKTLKTIWKKPLKIDAVKQLYKIIKKFKLEAHFSEFTTELKVISLKQLLSYQVADIFFIGVPQTHLKAVNHHLSKIEDITVHQLIQNQDKSVQIDTTDIHSTKAHAISYVLKQLNIDRQRAVGIGDGHNDYPLLQACGLKIAMGNAVKDLKAIADYVAPPVDQDGLATAINKFILS
jgi:HAD superfamily hydrolase (TIGR01484 family)